jgi:uroporphyrin-III C-methyltransferase
MIVYLVGAGPGDPGLITARGLELIRTCDVLVFDRLVARELVDEAPVGAMRIGRETLSQEEINRLLIELARAGRIVVRLKGGDPFLFGRGGEEVEALSAAGIRSEVVPGVSCLSAVPAAAGIPITHRGVSAQVTIAAGSGAGGALGLDLDALACAPGTLVLFMSLGRLDEIVDGLIARGKDPLTPAAVIASGTRAEQRTVVAALHKLPAAAVAASVVAPALVVIGDVVELADELDAAPSRSSSGNTSVMSRKPTVATMER